MKNVKPFNFVGVDQHKCINVDLTKGHILLQMLMLKGVSLALQSASTKLLPLNWLTRAEPVRSISGRAFLEE